MRGGYKIIDLRDVKLIDKDPTTAITGVGKADGVYEAIEGNYRKPLFLSNVNLNGAELADRFVGLKATTITAGGSEAINCYAGVIAQVGAVVDTIYILDDDRIFFHEA